MRSELMTPAVPLLLKFRLKTITMKNVEEVSALPSAKVFMQGAPPPRGWFVKYLSGMEDKAEIKPGFWLSNWHRDSKGYVFNFAPELDLHWDTEYTAREVSTALRELAGIETAVVKIGV
jgi:hypothetical protein